MAQYDQLLLFYNQLLNMADEIHELIEKELFDDILDKMQTHDKLLIQIRLAKKCAQLTPYEEEEVERLQKELKIKEKLNIELLQNNMNAVKLELDRLKMQNKLKRAYGQENAAQNQGSIIDVEDSYRPKEQ